MFPPGRARLATNSSSTGSAMPIATMGMMPVACLAGRVAVVLNVTIKSTLGLTSFAAASRSRFGIRFGKLALDYDVLPVDVTKFAHSGHERFESYAVWT